jgi:hypothetical protein
MSFGYLIFANGDMQYSFCAYALALSIKNTQKEGYDKVALVVDKKTGKSNISNFNSTWVFDEIIEFDGPEGWDVRSYMDELSPWDYTVCLDADMLFFRDFSHQIDYFIKNSELYIANDAYTYRGEKVVGDYYRKTFTANQLPNLYSFFTFFKKDSDLAKEFFNLQRAIIKNPTEFTNNFLSSYKPKVIGTDEAFALACKILDIEDEIAYPLEFPKVVHMKGMVQNWPYPADLVSDHVGFYFDKNANLKIGNYKQSNIVHYVEKDKINFEIINILEELVWKN